SQPAAVCNNGWPRFRKNGAVGVGDGRALALGNVLAAGGRLDVAGVGLGPAAELRACCALTANTPTSTATRPTGSQTSRRQRGRGRSGPDPPNSRTSGSGPPGAFTVRQGYGRGSSRAAPGTPGAVRRRAVARTGRCRRPGYG